MATQEYDHLDKVRGVLLGVAYGDAQGTPFEFKPGDLVYDGTIRYSPKVVNRFQGTRMGVPGQVSDDTEMALVIVRSVVAEGKYSKKNTTLEYMKWANGSPPCPFKGKNTRALFCGVKTMKGYESHFNKVFSKPQDEWSQSNGAMMRCAPLAFLPDSATTEDCEITNPHPVTVECNQIYTTLIRKLARDEITHVWRYAQMVNRKVKNESVKVAIKQAIDKIPRDISANRGWAVHALYATFYALIHLDGSIPQTCDWVIRQNPKSDTDTVAAIACAACGAKAGYSQILKDPAVKAEWEVILRAAPSKGGIPRQQEYTLHDFDALTQKFADVTKQYI